jgi:hypothetical protein
MVEGFETPKPERGESGLVDRRGNDVSEAAGAAALSHV